MCDNTAAVFWIGLFAFLTLGYWAVAWSKSRGAKW